MQNVRAIIEQNKQLQKENGRLAEELGKDQATVSKWCTKESS